jgi:ketosteroid isomerase-like protein
MNKIFSIVVFLLYFKSFSQNTAQEKLYVEVVALDKAVFDAYNNCDIEKFRSYFTDDAEFYHDKGGVILSGEKISDAIKNNLCSNPEVKVRREAIQETLQVYPMDNYGAIITGEHLFYQAVNGVEKPTGKAKFTHLCQFKDNRWKIHRVLSFDHREIK